MPPPDWQLPPGVDRGLWDYLHSADMVRGYDDQMAASALARADIALCEQVFVTPGRLLDVGCGTGRLCIHFAARGFACVGVDLSEEMLARADENARAAGVRVEWRKANLVDFTDPTGQGFDAAACLFSTLGMVRGADNRGRVVANVFRSLKPGGRFVLHVHNRAFLGLGAGRVVRNWWGGVTGRETAGDLTMPQSYGGALLTLHHFSRGEAVGLLLAAGFAVTRVVGLGLRGEPRKLPWHVYGYLLVAERPV